MRPIFSEAETCVGGPCYGKVTFTQVADRAAHAATPSYPHAVVDEAQDLHQAHWRLLRALVEPGPDDLLIAGDAHQRIYGKPVVLSRCGIETRGRSRRLTVNYRTSREILKWCLAVANGQAVDDLESEEDSLAGARSVFDGPEPEQVGLESRHAEAAGVAERLQGWHSDRPGEGSDGAVGPIPWGEMAVIAREKRLLDPVEEALSAGHVPVVRADAERDEDDLGDRVRLMSMHRAKGLEFRAVVLAGVSDRSLPPSYVRTLPEEARAVELAKERNLLYAAGSRARERLLVTWVGRPSSLLP